MALKGRLFSLVRPSQFYVQTLESRHGRITEIPLYFSLLWGEGRFQVTLAHQFLIAYILDLNQSIIKYF